MILYSSFVESFLCWDLDEDEKSTWYEYDSCDAFRILVDT